MKCAWQMLINILPIWMRMEVDRLYKDTLQEIRLRLHIPPCLITSTGNLLLDRSVGMEDLKFCVNIASRYSPWTTDTIADGYITAPGGHRIGICGCMASNDHDQFTIRQHTSVCIRVARDIPGLAFPAANINGSLLIVGKPGCGKTTLLRDLIRQWSDVQQLRVCLIDEKAEVFPFVNNQSCFSTGRNTDIISGCSKKLGIESMLRNMNPDVLAVDEITAQEDCEALLHAGWCGVRLIATAHAGCRNDLFKRPVYRSIIENRLFDHLIVMQPDRSWQIERM